MLKYDVEFVARKIASENNIDLKEAMVYSEALADINPKLHMVVQSWINDESLERYSIDGVTIESLVQKFGSFCRTIFLLNKGSKNPELLKAVLHMPNYRL